MSRIRGAAAVAALVVVLVTSGCVAGGPTADGTPTATATPGSTTTRTPTPSAVPTTPTPTAAPSPDAGGSPLTCEELVDPTRVQGLVENGLVADPLWPDETELYGTLHQRFTEFGGVSCRWGKPNTDNVWIFSYTPTTSQQSALVESELIAAGYTAEPRDRGTAYIESTIPGTFFLITGDEIFEAGREDLLGDLIPYRR